MKIFRIFLFLIEKMKKCADVEAARSDGYELIFIKENSDFETCFRWEYMELYDKFIVTSQAIWTLVAIAVKMNDFW